MRDSLASLLFLMCAACGPGRLITGDADSESSATSSMESESEGQNSDPSDSGPGDTDTDTDEGEASEGNLVAPEDMFLAEPCDLFAQDCADGDKCVPYSASGQTWDSVKCVPVMGDLTESEPCVSGGIVEATDDCDATSYCFDGTCHAFCKGTIEMPECPESQYCSISDASTLVLCLPLCDPVAQDCTDPGEGCFWTGTNFTCVPVANPPGLSPGEECDFANECEIGSICLDTSVLPDCNGTGCCGVFCDLGLGDMQCAVAPGTACIPFWANGEAPGGYEHVGVCALP